MSSIRRTILGQHDGRTASLYRDALRALLPVASRDKMDLLATITAIHESLHGELMNISCHGQLFSFTAHAIASLARRGKSSEEDDALRHVLSVKQEQLHRGSHDCQETYATYLSVLTFPLDDIPAAEDLNRECSPSRYQALYDEMEGVLGLALTGVYIKCLAAKTIVRSAMDSLKMSTVLGSDIARFLTSPMEDVETPDVVLRMLYGYLQLEGGDFLRSFRAMLESESTDEDGSLAILRDVDDDCVWNEIALSDNKLAKRTEEYITAQLYHNLERNFFVPNGVSVFPLLATKDSYYEQEQIAFRRFQVALWQSIGGEVRFADTGGEGVLRRRHLADQKLVLDPPHACIGCGFVPNEKMMEFLSLQAQNRPSAIIRVAPVSKYLKIEASFSGEASVDTSISSATLGYAFYISKSDREYYILYTDDQEPFRRFLAEHFDLCTYFYFPQTHADATSIIEQRDVLPGARLYVYATVNIFDLVDAAGGAGRISFGNYAIVSPIGDKLALVALSPLEGILIVKVFHPYVGASISVMLQECYELEGDPASMEELNRMISVLRYERVM